MAGAAIQGRFCSKLEAAGGVRRSVVRGQVQREHEGEERDGERGPLHACVPRSGSSASSDRAGERGEQDEGEDDSGRSIASAMTERCSRSLACGAMAAA